MCPNKGLYRGVTYEAVLYNVTEKSDDAQGWDTDAWFGPKKQLAAANPLLNLPYVMDGDKLITQSNACIVYLGDKVRAHARFTAHGMHGAPSATT